MLESVKEPQAADNGVETAYPGLAQIKAVIAFASAKGGTGKSTMVANFAIALALKGRKIGIVDADLDSPSVPSMLGMPRVRLLSAKGAVESVSGPFGIRVIANDPTAVEPPPYFASDTELEPGDLRVGDVHLGDESTQLTSIEDLLARAHFGPLDLLLIDLPPGFKNAVRLHREVERAGVVIVLPSSASAAAAARRSLEVARREGVRILGLIENMQGFYCGNCHSVRPLLPRSDLGALVREFDLPILGRMPFDSRLAESGDNGHAFLREYADAPLTKLINETALALWTTVSAPRPAVS
jgi:ATP-binding protein involved in chromosome partitioning